MPRFPDSLYDPSPPDPMAVVKPFLTRDPQWIVLGGLGDGNEAQCALRHWPAVQLIGVDLDPRAITTQQRAGWPAGHPLLQVALGAEVGVHRATLDQLNCASIHPSVVKASPGPYRNVAATTLDLLEASYGPFDDCLLWLDLEGWDSEALHGGVGLLGSGRVLLLNIEVRYETEAENRDMSELLGLLGYVRVWVWFRQWWGHNELWVKNT